MMISLSPNHIRVLLQSLTVKHSVIAIKRHFLKCWFLIFNEPPMLHDNDGRSTVEHRFTRTTRECVVWLLSVSGTFVVSFEPVGSYFCYTFNANVTSTLYNGGKRSFG